MPKPSVTLAAVLLAVGLGYLAYDPSVARVAADWVRRQVGQTPRLKDVGSPNYMPVTPAKGL